MRVRVRVDIIDDAEPGEENPITDLPCGEIVGGTVFAPHSGEMTAVAWAKLAGQVAMGLYKQARKVKPDICPGLFALRVADNTVGAIDAEDLQDMDPTGNVKRESLPRALAHGEGAAFTKG
jgi:hypothetical protein